jgi:hypothetical protein
MQMMSALCEFSNDFSTLLRRKNVEEEEKFLRKIHSLTNLVSSFQIALKQRRSLQVQYTATHKQIIDKDAALTKANKNSKPPEVTEKLQDERSQLEARCEREKKVLEEATQRLLKDAEKYKPQLEIKLKDAFLQYSKAQLFFTDRIKMAYSQLIPYLETTSETKDIAGNALLGGSSADASEPPPVAPPLEPIAGDARNNDDDDIVVEDLDGSGNSLDHSNDNNQ